MALTLYKFGSVWGIPDPSPFCVKLESYLKASGIEYDAPDFEMAFFEKAPKGKFPFIEDENAQFIGDSTLIIDHLIAGGHKDFDAELSPAARAQSLAYIALMDDKLYWVLLYSRWQDEPGWSMLSEMFFGGVPKLLRGYVQGKQQSKIIASLKAQGMNRHSREEIYAIGTQILQALSDVLGGANYLLGGDSFTLADLCLYAYIINFAAAPFENPMRDAVLSHDNLMAHARRIHKDVFESALDVAV